MKRIIQKLTVLLFILTCACESLELDPQNSTTADAFYTSAGNLETGLYGIYDALQQSGVFGHLPYLEGMSDNCISDPVFVADIAAYAAGDQVEATGPIVQMYEHNYVLIQRANLLLDFIDGIEGVSDSDRELIRSEARALRAISYMKLAYLFGGVPLLETFTGREEALAVNRASRGTIVSFVLDEMEGAGAVLGNDPAAEGRLTKQAVLGLRAKVMLFEARLGNQSWQEALIAINQAVAEADNGGHALMDTDNPASDYQSLFTEANEGNAEFIFSVKNSLVDNGISYQEDYSWVAGTLNMHIHQNLADAYGYADGTSYDPADDTFVGRDPRLSVNVMHEGLTFDGATYSGTDEGGFVGANSLNSVTNLFFYKFVTTDFTSSFNQGQLDIPVLRYADLLLMQAEALNETGGDGHPGLNLVRDRAGLPALSGLSQSDLRTEILRERRLELALEGHRWFDLVTSGIAEPVINGIAEESPLVIRNFTSGRSELLPIPQTEIGLNPSLTQNPGY